LLPISRWYPSFLDENTQIWMNNCTFIHNLDVSSTHMDEGGSCTVIKIASASQLHSFSVIDIACQ
jgi:hypothetical protein